MCSDGKFVQVNHWGYFIYLSFIPTYFYKAR